jgi:endonuclease V-like protein UPF0215 family
VFTSLYNKTKRDRHIHIEKKGIRAFGIAESFRSSGKLSVLAGVVMRRDLVIDGIVISNSTLKGDDSTENIISMYKMLQRNDINCIMLDGLIISMYNIINGDQIYSATGIPIIAITFEDSTGIEDNIRNAFPQDWKWKLEQYKNLGKRYHIKLRSGKPLFIRHWGLSLKNSVIILNYFTLQGAIPEPIRIAKLVARANIRQS